MQPLRTLHLFAGAGGGILADILLGHRPVCAVEINTYCQLVLMQRQAEGYLPWFPIFGDIKEFDATPWRGHVDSIAGGFPCQDISPAGKGAGLSGPRSGLWTEFARIISEVRPRYAFIENAATLTVRGLDRILADLAALGMDARWCRLGADDVGAWHQRKRTWILAYRNTGQCDHAPHTLCPGRDAADCLAPDTTSGRQEALPPTLLDSQHADHGRFSAGAICRKRPGTTDLCRSETTADPQSPGTPTAQQSSALGIPSCSCNKGQSQPDLGGLVYGVADGLGGAPWDVPDPFNVCGVLAVAPGVPDRTQRIMALGNGQVPLCAAMAWCILTAGLGEKNAHA